MIYTRGHKRRLVHLQDAITLDHEIHPAITNDCGGWLVSCDPVQKRRCMWCFEQEFIGTFVTCRFCHQHIAKGSLRLSCRTCDSAFCKICYVELCQRIKVTRTDGMKTRRREFGSPNERIGPQSCWLCDDLLMQQLRNEVKVPSWWTNGIPRLCEDVNNLIWNIDVHSL